MTKQPEEGKIWEWRAFGRVSDDLASQVRAYPIRSGLDNIRGEDIYVVAPHSQQNVKLRRSSDGWALKFKMLLETKAGGWELYNESAEFSYRFPVAREQLKEAARLLTITLPESALSAADYVEDDFLDALAGASPPASHTRVSKRRSQYQFEGGWLELAEVEFPSRAIQSLSIHSPEFEIAREMLELLRPSGELEALGYVDACRRWG